MKSILTIFIILSLVGGVYAQNFTVVVIPDTQKYSWLYPETFTNQINWILDNKEDLNIRVVLHLGDIVEHRWRIPEWENANKSISLLKGKVPYLLLAGDHDYLNYKFRYFNYLFRFKNLINYKKYFGEPHDYYLDEENRIGFISLENNPNMRTLEWADKILLENKDYSFIISTHKFLKRNQELSEPANNIWNKFRDNKNVFMIVNGHYDYENNTILQNDFGDNVTAILSNYQVYPGELMGKLRYYEFVPETNKIYAYTYNVNEDRYDKNKSSQFAFHQKFNKNYCLGIVKNMGAK